jgi:hypothetical protein
MNEIDGSRTRGRDVVAGETRFVTEMSQSVPITGRTKRTSGAPAGAIRVHASRTKHRTVISSLKWNIGFACYPCLFKRAGKSITVPAGFFELRKTPSRLPALGLVAIIARGGTVRSTSKAHLSKLSAIFKKAD